MPVGRMAVRNDVGASGAKADKLREKFAAAAKERQKRKPKSVPVNSPEQKADARDQVGKVFGISGNSVDKGHRVRRDAIPEASGKFALPLDCPQERGRHAQIFRTTVRN